MVFIFIYIKSSCVQMVPIFSARADLLRFPNYRRVIVVCIGWDNFILGSLVGMSGYFGIVVGVRGWEIMVSSVSGVISGYIKKSYMIF